MSERMKFIPGMKDLIVKELVGQGCNKLEVLGAIEGWNNGREPITNFEKGCFNFFQEVSGRILKGEFN